MPGVLSRLIARERRYVRSLVLLRNITAGDAMVFDPEMPPVAVLVEVRLDIFKRQVPADIAIKLAIHVAARIPDLSAPDLPACLDIATEDRDAIRAKHRSMNAIARPRIAVENRMR